GRSVVLALCGCGLVGPVRLGLLAINPEYPT
ncbi:MAG: hypothetical protein RL541_862, partial [Pseudomonadota bacterium]